MRALSRRVRLTCALVLMAEAVARPGPLQAAPAQQAARPPARPPKGRLFLLVDFPYQLWSQGGTQIHLAAFTPEFRPAVGAEVTLAGQRRGRTDARGTLVFGFRSPPDWKGADLVVRLRHRGRIHEARQRIEAYRRTSSYEMERVYLYTDRGIYRPGERLRARLVAFRMRDRYEPLGGKRAVLTLESAYGDIVQRQELRLDAFGVGHAEVDLRELEPVRHTLRVAVGRASHERTVKLALFKRPMVEIRHGLPTWFTARTPELSSRITLVGVDGKPPRAGRLEIAVSAGGQRLSKKELPIDGRPAYPHLLSGAELRRLARRLAPGRSFQVAIRARLGDGTTAESEHEVRLERQPYRAVLELDRDDYARGDRVTALVKLTDPDDLPAGDVPVTLALPWGVRLQARSNAQGTAAFAFQLPEKAAHTVLLKAYVPEVDGHVARATVQVEKPRPMLSRLGVAQVVSRRRVPITVSLTPGFTPLEQVLHVDVTDHSGAIVLGFTLPWRRRGSGWEASGHFQAPSWGSMLLTMFSLAARTGDLRPVRGRPRRLGPKVVGVIMDGQQVTVHPDEALRLTVTGVPEEARPGQPLAMTLQVRGPDGKPRDALVGGALVDANVLALGDPLHEISPVPYFYNPELRTMASTGSKMLTWPVLARTWACHRYDMALPPFGFAEGGPEECLEGLSGFGIGGGGGGYGFGLGGSPERFTLRQRFDPTSWWAPALVATAGRLQAKLTLPDQISRQVLLLVASDKQGGIGVFRRVFRVAKPFSLEVDLPEQLTAGEELEVVCLARNDTGKPLDLTLAARGQGVELLAAPARLRVPVGPATPFRVRLRARRPGKAFVELRASQGREGDALRKSFWIRPAGEPRRELGEAVARSGHPASLTLWRQPADPLVRASLRVDYPHVVPAIQSAASALLHPSLGGDTSVSLLQTAALVLRQGPGLGLPDEARARLAAWLSESVHWLYDTQAKDGSWAYWRLGLPDPVHTAYVLETLLDIRDAGIRLPRGVAERAVAYLLGSLAKDGLWDHGRLAFWEGRGPDVRSGLSAGIFRALARASALTCPKARDPRLLDLAARMTRAATGASRDPRTVAAALEGLNALYRRCQLQPKPRPARRGRGRARLGRSPVVVPPLPKAEQTTLETGVAHLLSLRLREHWEPTWFDAYGGQLEATAAALRVLHRLSPTRHASAIREAVRYLTARRHSWGEWHNERGTASAIRALLEVAAAAPRERAGARIRILVNGKQVKELRLDPRDPWATAAALGRLRLSDLLSTGKNQVEVRYDGAFALPVRLEVKRWGAPAAPRSHSQPGRGAPIALPASLRHGQEVLAQVSLPSSRGRSGLRIVLPAHLALDAPRLAALRRSHPWLGVTVRGSALTLTWPARPPLGKLSLPLRAARRGRGQLTWRPLPGTSASPGSLWVHVE